MDTPSISVLMTVHNRRGLVAHAVKSVLAQTRRDLELIVWDDGSTDGSLDHARSAAAGDERVRFFRGEQRGAAPALKAAHAHARGSLLGWVDSDDILAPAALEETAAVLAAEPSTGLVYTDHVVIDESGRPLGLGRRCTIPYSKERLLVDFMTFHFRLFRREVYDAAGGIDESYAAAHDYDFCLRVSEVAQIRHLAKPLYAYRDHGASISAARRVDQIQSAKVAIERALERRGLAATTIVEVEVVGRYKLRSRPADGPSSGGPGGSPGH